MRRYLAHEGNIFKGVPTEKQLPLVGNASLIPLHDGVVVLTGGGSYTFPQIFQSLSEAEAFLKTTKRTGSFHFLTFESGKQIVDGIIEDDFYELKSTGYYYGGAVILYTHEKAKALEMGKREQRVVNITSLDAEYEEHTQKTSGTVWFRECPYYPLRVMHNPKIFV
jgi:hypothetical protein